MNHDDADRYLEADTPVGSWVAIDVVQHAFLTTDGRPLSKRRAYELAKTEGWRTAPGHRPRQYAFVDVQTTYRRRKATR